MTWYMIECLCPPAMSVIFKDGDRREWASVRSIMRSDGVDATEVLASVQQSKQTVDLTLQGRQGSKRVQIIPIIGFDGDVYGMQLWVGDLAHEPTPPRSCAAINWDIETLTARHTIDSYMMSSLSPAGFGLSRDPGEFLRKVVQFDNLNELVELCLNDGGRTHFEGKLSVLHDDGHLMAWRAFARSAAGPDKSEIRGISHDVTDAEGPEIGPLTALRLTELATRPDDVPAAALIAYRQFDDGRTPVPVITYWISPRPSYLAQSAVGAEQGNLIHPEDYEEINRARTILLAGQDELEISIRIRLLGSTGDDWVMTNCDLRRYPGAIGGSLHIARFLPTQTTV